MGIVVLLLQSVVIFQIQVADFAFCWVNKKR